jgi:PAS domain S-box-containing protein
MHKELDTEHAEKILVVDDTTANLQLLTDLLSERGYAVYPASDGELALAFVQSTLPNLILLDIRMPGMDGFEVCRRLKADERTRSVPVIFISILEDEDDKVKGFQSGAVDYISKPFQAEEVLARVSLHLKLRKLAEHLEQTVAQRTEALHNANTQLQRELAERKQMEAALRKSEEKYRALFENVNEGFALHEIITDESGVPADYKFLEINPAFEAMTGLERAKVIGRNVTEVLPGIEEDPADWIGKYGKVALTGKSINFENYAEAMGRWYNVNAFSPRARHFAVTFMDITERKAAEKRLQRLNAELDQRILDRTAELEAANKEMHAFTYTVSHDLRAPLRHIQGFLELLQKEMGTAADEQSRHYMENIGAAARKMGLLTDDLLTFSRIGRHAVVMKQIDMGRLIKEILRDVEPDTAKRTIDWCIGDLPVVNGDLVLLKMVLTNLIANALKFTRHRKQARIEIGSLPAVNGEVVVFVRDNGVGFNIAYEDKLFGVFQRLHHDDEFEGTGIGLAFVQRIIARHGGRTWAEGIPGMGATFYFSLPYAVPGGGNE